jgi:hypothetical protein
MHVCAAAAKVTNSGPKSSLYYTESPNGYLRQAPNDTVEKTLVRKIFKKTPTTG